jgi:glycosyltransferase involved in cell wall biosynthesis
MTSPTAQQERRPLRILMIAPTSFFSDYGGHIRILEETRVLQDFGHHVAIVTYYKGSDMPGLDIRRTMPLPWRTDYEVGSSRHKLAFDVLLAVQSLRDALRFRPDVIHGHMHEGALIGGVLSRLLKVPLIFDFQGSLTAEMVDHHFLKANGSVFNLVHRVERFISRRLPNAILTSSIQAGNLLQDEFQVNPAIINPLPDCADTEHFRPNLFAPVEIQSLRQSLNIPQDAVIVAYLGLLTDYQGIPYLINSASILREAGENVHFLIMGYPNVDQYRMMAANMGVAASVTFTGKVEYRDAAKYLALGDIAVAPKISASEGSGKLLNYMAMAQPVVAFDTPVHREYLADLGIYAPVADTRAFAAAIQQLAHDPQERTKLGHKLRLRALDQYNWQRAGRDIESLYYRLTS